MNGRYFGGGVIAALAIVCTAGLAFSQTFGHAETSGPAKNGSPAWHLQGSFPDPGGNTIVDNEGHVTVPERDRSGASRVAASRGVIAACTDDAAKLCSSAAAGPAQRACLQKNADGLSPSCKTALTAAIANASQGCSHSTICTRKGGPSRGAMQRVEYDNNMGYTYSYPYPIPVGSGGIPSVALDSKGNLWVFKRAPAGTPQLLKFSPDHKLILSVGDDVIHHQEKAHGMAVDKDDNVWICDAGEATVTELSPEGKVLLVIGTKGHRGDWVEDKGQRLLWQPVMVAFAPNGDLFIAEGHSNESPNDTDSDDPTNNLGTARVIHLTHDGKYVSQFYGDDVGPGKFDAVHGFAIDPKNGNLWVGDREQYRIVVYTNDGKYLRTMDVRNLVCALEFDPHGNPWMASGQDGQFQKLTQDGKVIGAVGNGMGIGPGQFIEASYFVFDKNMNIYAGDTSVGRVTVMVAPKKKK